MRDRKRQGHPRELRGYHSSHGTNVALCHFLSHGGRTVRTFLPKEIRLALRSHKALFFPGGLVLSVTSSISAPAVFIFQMTLLTLLCLEQLDQVLTPTERPRPASEEATGRAPQGYTPWLLHLLTKVAWDAAEGAQSLPWITPALIAEGASLSWASSGNTRTIRGNKSISFCPGAIITSIPHPYVSAPVRATPPLATIS